MYSASNRRQRRPLVRTTGYHPPATKSADIIAYNSRLPVEGSRLKNKHGIEWVVQGHVQTNSIMTQPGDQSASRDYPVIFPQNLSSRLQEFTDEVSRCSPKVLVPLDTMPSVFPERAHPGGHFIDAWSNPDHIYIFIDAENVSEVVFAHELAHAWIDFVKDIEDCRVWSNRDDFDHYAQVQFLQSFVLDFAVDEVLDEKGFDRLQIKADSEIAIMQLRVAAERGYRPQNPREAVFLASHLASSLVKEDKSNLPAQIANILPVLRRNLPEMFDSANALASAVADNFPVDRVSTKRAVDIVFAHAFALTDPGLDWKKGLIIVEPEINWETDKAPDWLKGQPVRAKCEIGVAMAKLGATSSDAPVLNQRNDLIEVCFSRPDGTVTDSIALKHVVMPPSERIKRINEMIEEQRRAKIRKAAMQTNAQPGQTAAITNPMDALRSRLPSGQPFPKPPFPGGRTYSPGVARWITKVRMEEMLAGEHPYAYANNNPTTSIDPSGNQTLTCPVHGGYGSGCVFSGPSGSSSDPAYWHCRDRYPAPREISCYECLTEIYNRTGKAYKGTRGFKNAMRHCVGTCLAYQECGGWCAPLVILHELQTWFTDDSRKDRHNNDVGAGFGQIRPKVDCHQKCGQAYKDGKLL